MATGWWGCVVCFCLSRLTCFGFVLPRLLSCEAALCESLVLKMP